MHWILVLGEGGGSAKKVGVPELDSCLHCANSGSKLDNMEEEFWPHFYRTEERAAMLSMSFFFSVTDLKSNHSMPTYTSQTFIRHVMGKKCKTLSYLLNI